MALANKADQAPARRGQRCSERSECSNAHRARARRGAAPTTKDFVGAYKLAPARAGGQRLQERTSDRSDVRGRARRGQRQRWQSCHHRNRQGRVIFYLNSLPKPLPVIRPAILRPTRRETEPLRLDVIACASPRYLARV